MTQSVVAEPLSSSSSTYGAVLINPSSLDTSRPFNAALANASTASLASNTTPHRPPRLTYPFPLFLAAALDVAYTTYNFNLWSGATTEDDGARTFAIILTAIRVTVLVLICGCSKRWRSRGGWVAAASGVSVGAAIWRDCVDQLTGAKMGRKAEKSVFLYTTILIAMSEYLLFLILLRLSPPTYRARPLSLLHPASADQQAVPFAYTSQDAIITPRSTRLRHYSTLTSSPLSPHPGMHHRTRLSTNTFSEMTGAGPSRGMTSGNDYLSAEQYAHAHINAADLSNPYSTSNEEQNSGEESFTDEYESEYDYDCDSASFISESSIIDLPPPLESHRIIPPSISMRSNLAHALDSSPLLGPIAGRTRSMQMLARSFGSVMQGEAADEAMRRMRGEHGTEGGVPQPLRPDVERSISGYGTFEGTEDAVGQPTPASTA